MRGKSKTLVASIDQAKRHMTHFSGRRSCNSFWQSLISGITFVLVGGAISACNKSDVGQCCEALPGSPAVVPTLEYGGGDKSPIDNIKIDPGFDCEGLACVLYKGSPTAYCTKECEFDDNCPEGFTCRPVLDSQACDEDHVTPDTSDDCPEGAVTTKDKFCVKESAHDCKASE